MGLFGPEKMILTLERYDYKPGDVIKGTVKLQLKKPLMARKLEVGLIGKKIEHQSGMSMGSRGVKHSSSTQHVKVYDFRIPLSGEQEYLEGTFPFELKIQSDILQNQPQLQGTAATAMNVLKAISGVSSRIEWIVLAELDMPMKLDVNASQKIIIS